MSAVAKVPLRMTVTEFLAWASVNDGRYELVDGEPRAMAPPSTVHGYLQIELGALIRQHLNDRGRQCRIVGNPGVIPRLFSAHNMRVPDLAVTCSPLAKAQSALPEPVLVIEILSPSNQADTWTNVWTYTSIPSVQEILVLHTDRIAANLLRRSPDGAWPAESENQVDGDVRLASIDFQFNLAALYADTPLTA